MDAIERGATGDDAASQRLPAPATGLAGPVVDLMLELVAAEALEAVAVVGDGRPPSGDGPGQHLAGRRDHPPAFGSGEPGGSAARSDAGVEQDLVDVDVAEAGDLALIHEERLHGGPTMAARGGVQGFRRQAVGQRIHSRDRFRADGFARNHRQPTEAAGVVVGERAAVLQTHDDVIVRQRRARAVAEREASRHAQVHQPDVAVVEIDQDELAVPAQLDEAPPGEPGGEVRRQALAQPGLAHHYAP